VCTEFKSITHLISAIRCEVLGRNQYPFYFYYIIIINIDLLGRIMEGSDFEQNQKDITSIMKDGMIIGVPTKGPDGQSVTEFRINSKSAWWKTHNINHHAFGLAAEAVEYLAAIGHDAQYNMSGPRAAIMSAQIEELVDGVLKLSIDAKSSESMRDGKNAQTSVIDKYLKNKQERVIDLKGEMAKSGLAGIFGSKEAERDD